MIASFPSNSRVWIYQSSRELSPEETDWVQNQALAFVKAWTSHNQQLRGTAVVRYQRFLILCVDESAAGASGCAIDKSMHFIQNLGKQLDVDFLDRMLFSFKTGGKVNALHRDAFAEAYREGRINDETIVFNNLADNLGALDQQWEVPLAKSWHRNFV